MSQFWLAMSCTPRRLGCSLYGLVLLTVLQPSVVIAQVTAAASSSRFEGVVTDTLSHPISDVRVSHVASGLGARTDTLGRFRITDLPAGPAMVSVRRFGYLPGDFLVVLPADSPLVVSIQLTPAAFVLDTLQVRAADINIGLQLSGFLDRLAQHVGSATFITPEDIERRRPQHTSDLLDHVPGVHLNYYRGRAIMYGRDQCLMNVWVDGHFMNLLLYGPTSVDQGLGKFGVLPSGLDPVDVYVARSGGLDALVGGHEVEAIEIYQDPAQVPPQFYNMNGSCGSIVIWTK